MKKNRDGDQAWVLLKYGLAILAGVAVLSTGVYYALGQYYGQNWSVMDCVFMVAITLSTIGYGDWLHLRGKTLAEVFTILLAFAGIGIPAFIISTVTAMIVDGTVGNVYRRRRMQKEIGALSGHVVVCGVGNTGLHCLQELLKLGRTCVVVERSLERIKDLQRRLGPFPFVDGNAEEDQVLSEAGIERASHLVTCLTEDRDNLFVTLSAKLMNPEIRVVSKGISAQVRSKILKAGAAAVVSPSAIGGLRMASELVRPVTTSFLDTMLRDKATVRFDELIVEAGSAMEGQTLARPELRMHAQVVALKEPESEAFTYNPKAELVLREGATVVVLGAWEEVQLLRTLFEGKKKENNAQ